MSQEKRRRYRFAIGFQIYVALLATFIGWRFNKNLQNMKIFVKSVHKLLEVMDWATLQFQLVIKKSIVKILEQNKKSYD